VLAFEKEMGLSKDQLSKISIGFGGGFGRQRLTCGAVSGMTMVLSYLLSDGEDKLAIYKIIQNACAEVKAQLGSLTCAELLDGVTKDNSPIPDARTAEYYKKRPCAEICEICANITEKYLKHE
jgi:C_GCAxxG_C_C family probable redox protein